MTSERVIRALAMVARTRACSVTGSEMLACLQAIDSAAIRALGFTRMTHIQIDLGVRVPGLHVGQRARAKNATLVVQVLGQEFYGCQFHNFLYQLRTMLATVRLQTALQVSYLLSSTSGHI
jgi:hypothetical protein